MVARERARSERREGTPAFQAAAEVEARLGGSRPDAVEAARTLRSSSSEQTQRDALATLRRTWAELERELHAHVGAPNDPEAKRIIAEQMAITKLVHHHYLDRGRAGDVGVPGEPYDVVVVGAGPAGLSGAIYGAAEGLDTLLLDASTEPGGQVGMSSRVENVLGFPAGATGEQIARAGLAQAQRLGAAAQLGERVSDLSHDPRTGLKTLTLASGRTVSTRSVIIAGGLQPRKLDIPGGDSPSIVYGDSELIRAQANGGPAVIVGGGNSAGQAALDVAEHGSPVTMLLRSGGLGKNMSPYLQRTIEAHPNIRVRTGSEIRECNLDINGRIVSITLKDGSTIDCAAVGIFIGSGPETTWVGDVERDERGLIKVKGSGSLETNVPGVFAAGDVRVGAVGRVVAAASDGAMAVGMSHGYLEAQIQVQAAAAAI